MKFCKDGHLVDATFRTQDVDLLFTKSKDSATVKKILFVNFLSMLEAIAFKKNVTVTQFVEWIIQVNSEGPSNSGTVAGSNRFYDDQSLYTGVHKAGGPTTIDHQNLGLSSLVNRSNEADVRGR